MLNLDRRGINCTQFPKLIVHYPLTSQYWPNPHNRFFLPIQSNMNFTLKHSKCPAGYKLDGTTGKCQCEVTDVVIFCLDHGEGLLLAVSLWLDYWSHSHHTSSCMQGGLWGASKCHQELAYYPCPPGYCNCINRNSSSEISEFDEGCQLRYGDSSDSSNTSDANDAICSSKRTGGPWKTVLVDKFVAWGQNHFLVQAFCLPMHFYLWSNDMHIL